MEHGSMVTTEVQSIVFTIDFSLHTYRPVVAEKEWASDR